MNEQQTASIWRPTACILCYVNCGIEVMTEGRGITRVRGDKAHPSTQGYLCQKAQRLNFYQNHADRLTTPLRRRADGSFAAIDWDTWMLDRPLPNDYLEELVDCSQKYVALLDAAIPAAELDRRA